MGKGRPLRGVFLPTIDGADRWSVPAPRMTGGGGAHIFLVLSGLGIFSWFLIYANSNCRVLCKGRARQMWLRDSAVFRGRA